jgi:hypothetical protein
MELAISPDGFVNALANIRKGLVIEELDRELIRAVEAVMDNGGKATITLKVDISRIKNLESAVTLKPEVTTKLPKEEAPEQAMFVNSTHGLVSQHQEQLGLDMNPSAGGSKQSLRPAAGNNVTPLNPADKQR